MDSQDEFLERHTKAESLKYSAPGLMESAEVANAFANGSPKARRQARIYGLVVIGIMFLPVLIFVANWLLKDSVEPINFVP